MCHNRAEEAVCEAGRKETCQCGCIFHAFVQGPASLPCTSNSTCQTQMVPDNYYCNYHHHLNMSTPTLCTVTSGSYRVHMATWRRALERARHAMPCRTVRILILLLTKPRASPCQRGLLRRLGSSLVARACLVGAHNKRCRRGTTSSDRTPISHDPNNRARASNIHKLPAVSAWASNNSQGATVSTFSCQLSNTLMAWPPPSPPPRAWIWEKPVG